MIKKKYANQTRLRRHQRVRKKVSGTPMRPRLSVFRSANQIYAQIIDDERKTTLVAASSRDPELAELAKAEASSAPAAPRPAPRPKAEPAEQAEPKASAKSEAKGKGKSKGDASAPAAAAEAAPDEGGESALPFAGIAGNRRVMQARLVGRLIAQRAKGRGIEKVVFDRGGYLYHGRVAALATGAREGGLDF